MCSQLPTAEHRNACRLLRQYYSRTPPHLKIHPSPLSAARARQQRGRRPGRNELSWDEMRRI
jgi:hypothetical protein